MRRERKVGGEDRSATVSAFIRLLYCKLRRVNATPTCSTRRQDASNSIRRESCESRVKTGLMRQAFELLLTMYSSVYFSSVRFLDPCQAKEDFVYIILEREVNIYIYIIMKFWKIERN